MGGALVLGSPKQGVETHSQVGTATSKGLPDRGACPMHRKEKGNAHGRMSDVEVLIRGDNRKILGRSDGSWSRKRVQGGTSGIGERVLPRKKLVSTGRIDSKTRNSFICVRLRKWI